MCELLLKEGVGIDATYHCPHLRADGCECRKLGVGLVRFAVKNHGFDPCFSFAVGDYASDIALGKGIGATTFLVRTGYGYQIASEGRTDADYVVEDVAAAAGTIEGLLGNDKEF
jgi:D-glycero-D-manno-heptose 1,7-bisphosphate phosphatase